MESLIYCHFLVFGFLVGILIILSPTNVINYDKLLYCTSEQPILFTRWRHICRILLQHYVFKILAMYIRTKNFRQRNGDAQRDSAGGGCRGTHFSQGVWKCGNAAHLRGLKLLNIFIIFLIYQTVVTVQAIQRIVFRLKFSWNIFILSF